MVVSDHSSDPAVQVNDLNIRAGAAYLVRDVSFAVMPGEICALIGESGSGKTTTALALLGYTRSGAFIESGKVQIGAHDVIGRSQEELQGIRGRDVAYVPQDPASALNPSMSVGRAIRSMIVSNLTRSSTGSDVGQDVGSLVAGALQRVELPDSPGFQKRYPHQLSGGQQQRVALAIAMACNPGVLVLDEPTTGLDVRTEHNVLAEILELREKTGTAVIYVTHDLRIAKRIADRALVLYGGEVVEAGGANSVLVNPEHPYTNALLRAAPLTTKRKLIPIRGTAVRPELVRNACSFRDRCDNATAACASSHPKLTAGSTENEVRCFNPVLAETAPRAQGELVSHRPTAMSKVLEISDMHVRYGRSSAAPKILDGVSLTVADGEAVGVLGLSGSGKSTLLKATIGLTRPMSGRVSLMGETLAGSVQRRTTSQRRNLGFVFQNPYKSLNPSRSTIDTVARAAKVLMETTNAEALEEARSMLSLVRLPTRLWQAYPHQLSGGERQRVAIAQALVGRPRILLCDEITSALDVSVQAAIVELLRELALTLNMALLFVTHDIGVVTTLCSRLYILDNGRVVEEGLVADVLSNAESTVGREIVSIHSQNSSSLSTTHGPSGPSAIASEWVS